MHAHRIGLTKKSSRAYVSRRSPRGSKKDGGIVVGGLRFQTENRAARHWHLNSEKEEKKCCVQLVFGDCWRVPVICFQYRCGFHTSVFGGETSKIRKVKKFPVHKPGAKAAA